MNFLKKGGLKKLFFFKEWRSKQVLCLILLTRWAAIVAVVVGISWSWFIAFSILPLDWQNIDDGTWQKAEEKKHSLSLPLSSVVGSLSSHRRQGEKITSITCRENGESWIESERYIHQDGVLCHQRLRSEQASTYIIQRQLLLSSYAHHLDRNKYSLAERANHLFRIKYS